MNLLLGHLVGDYLLQNDWMGINKSKPGFKNALICMLHSSIWTASICVFCWNWVVSPPSWWSGIGVVARIFMIWYHHYALDRNRNIVRAWMDFFGNFKSVKEPYRTYILYGYDNIFHLLFVFLVLEFL